MDPKTCGGCGSISNPSQQNIFRLKTPFNASGDPLLACELLHHFSVMSNGLLRNKRVRAPARLAGCRARSAGIPQAVVFDSKAPTNRDRFAVTVAMRRAAILKHKEQGGHPSGPHLGGARSERRARRTLASRVLPCAICGWASMRPTLGSPSCSTPASTGRGVE